MNRACVTLPTWALLRLICILLLIVCACRVTAQAGDMAEAERLIAAGMWAEAEKLLQPLAAAEAHNFRAHLLLGQARYRQGDLTNAARSLTTARLLRPDDPEAARMLGDVRFTQADYDRAAQAYEQARRNGAQDALTAYRLGLAYQRLGRGVEAQQVLYSAALRFTSDVAIIAALARVNLQLGRASEAAYWFRRACALKPTDTGLLREMIDALIGAGNLLEAQTELQRHLASYPNDADALRSLARVYTGLGLSMDARDVYRKLQAMGALTRADREALFVNLIGAALWEQALDHYPQLTGSRDAGLHDAAAGAYAQLRRHDEAIQALLRAEALSPSKSRLRTLGGVYSVAGRHEDAHSLYLDLLGRGNDRELMAAAAGSALKAGRTVDGISLLNLLAATDPGSYGLRLIVAEAVEHAGDLGEALRQWSVAADLEGADRQTSLLTLARLAAAAGYRTWALEQLSQLDFADLSVAQLLEAGGLAADLADGATATRAAEMVLETDAANPGQYATAGDLLLEWNAAGRAGRLAQRHAAFPSEVTLADVHARALIATGEPRKALAVCRRTISTDPRNPIPYATAIDAAAAAELWVPLTDILTGALGEAADNAIAADFLRIAWEKGHGPQRAAAEMDALARLHPESNALAAAAGRALQEARLWVEAAEYYKRLAGEYGRAAAAEAAECYVRAGRLSKARDVLVQSIPNTPGRETIIAVAEVAPLDAALELLAEEPGGVAYYLTVAKLFAAADKTADGIALLEALAAVDRVPEARVARAYLLQWRGDYARAVTDLESLPRALSDDPEAALLLAWAYLGAGNFVAANATAYRVVSTDIAVRRRVHEVAGQAAMGMGDAEGALRHFCLALSANARSAVAADGIRDLCRMRMIPSDALRRELTHLYRYTDDPGPVQRLAHGLAELPGYEQLARWARDRAAIAR